MAEWIDVYNANREKTGQIIDRKSDHLKDGQYMLYILALLETPDHKFLITQRALDKKWAAGDWEVPGGGVQSGESSMDALKREVAEETGLDLASRIPGFESKAIPINRYRNDEGDPYFMDIYHFCFPFTETDITLQKSEAIACRLASWDEIRELNDRSTFLHYKRICHALKMESIS